VERQAGAERVLRQERQRGPSRFQQWQRLAPRHARSDSGRRDWPRRKWGGWRLRSQDTYGNLTRRSAPEAHHCLHQDEGTDWRKIHRTYSRGIGSNHQTRRCYPPDTAGDGPGGAHWEIHPREPWETGGKTPTIPLKTRL